ncbi:MAG: hypothetical protein JKY89_13320 [Immundisolibacteraceae bacterium]|nr:hypothetical protein [Immundisolibacteraceae bacterium]
MAMQALASQAIHAMIQTIDKVGIGSVITILGIEVASESGKIELANSIMDSFGAFDWVKLIATIGAITFVIKNLIESRRAYLTSKKTALEIKILEKTDSPDKENTD